MRANERARAGGGEILESDVVVVGKDGRVGEEGESSRCVCSGAVGTELRDDKTDGWAGGQQQPHAQDGSSQQPAGETGNVPCSVETRRAPSRPFSPFQRARHVKWGVVTEEERQNADSR